MIIKDIAQAKELLNNSELDAGEWLELFDFVEAAVQYQSRQAELFLKQVD